MAGSTLVRARRWVEGRRRVDGSAVPVHRDLALFASRPALAPKLLPTSRRCRPTSADDGKPVQTFARERRVQLAYDEYPPLVVHAFISAEDKTFFSHGGLDYPGLIGASAIMRRKASPAARRGGSTITQQVAKILLQDDDTTRPQDPRGDPRLRLSNRR